MQTPDPVLAQKGAAVPGPAPLDGATARALALGKVPVALNMGAASRMRCSPNQGPSAPAPSALFSGAPSDVSEGAADMRAQGEAPSPGL